MSERAENLRNVIADKQKLINEGVGADREQVLRVEIKGLQEELDSLEQELPDTETVEPILATINGIALENYTEYPTLIRDEVEAIIGVRDLIAKEAHDETKNKLKIEQGLVRDLLERNGRLEKDYQEVIESESELQTKVGEQTLTIADLEQKHKAAGNRIVELEEELREAYATINRNKEFKALTEAERTAEAEAERQRFLDSRVKIYNPRTDEDDNRYRIAYLAETGEETRYLEIYEKGKNIIAEDEALMIQQMSKPLPTPELEVTEEEIFPETTSGENAPSLDESEDQGEQRETMEVESETFIERRQTPPDTQYRLAELEQRMKRVERQIFGEAEVA